MRDAADYAKTLAIVPNALCSLIYKNLGAEPLEALALAIQAGAPLNGRCLIMGRTALMLCAQKGWSACVKILLDAGADPKERDEFGRDALMMALIARKMECAALLAPASEISRRDADGSCALALAVEHAPHKVDANMIGMLWSHGAELWADRAGKSAADYAIDNEVDVFMEAVGFKRSKSEASAISSVISKTGLACNKRLETRPLRSL